MNSYDVCLSLHVPNSRALRHYGYNDAGYVVHTHTKAHVHTCVGCDADSTFFISGVRQEVLEQS